jgi:hypothetical protein
MEGGIAVARVLKPFPARCKLFQCFNFSSTHSDPHPPVDQLLLSARFAEVPMQAQFSFSNAIALAETA